MIIRSNNNKSLSLRRREKKEIGGNGLENVDVAPVRLNNQLKKALQDLSIGGQMTRTGAGKKKFISL